MTQSIENKQPDGPEPAQTTFTWEANHDCTDLTCRLPDGYYLRVEQMDKHSWWWDCCHDNRGSADPDHLLVTGLIEAMRAAQAAYLEHVKTTTP
jgi:hypothetical protein